MRRFLPFALLLLLLASCVREDRGEGNLSIVAVDFPSFDAARAVLGGDDGLVMLLPPGTESHSYDPTPKDMVTIAEADLIIYTGGHSDAWVDSILSSLSSPPRAFRLMEQVPLLSEERTEGMEDDGHGHHDGSDEHVWTSPVNEAAIVSSLADAISAIEPERSEELHGNAEAYIASLEALDGEIRKIVEESPLDTLIFASRFPLLYFVKEYGLRYYAAFPGCAEETEPSARTVAFLIDKAKELGVPCILNIEMSSDLIARTIAEEAGVPVYTFSSLHNVTAREFASGETYITIMERNADILREALGGTDQR